MGLEVLYFNVALRSISEALAKRDEIFLWSDAQVVEQCPLLRSVGLSILGRRNIIWNSYFSVMLDYGIKMKIHKHYVTKTEEIKGLHKKYSSKMVMNGTR
jgi:hypothetical protein